MIAYQYTLIKYVHNDASGECVNVGLSLLAPEHRKLKVKFNPRYGRISRFFRNAFDSGYYRNMIRALTEQFDRLSERLRMPADDPAHSGKVPDQLAPLMEAVLPEDSTAFRWGPICGGVSADVDDRFDALIAEFITRHERPTPRPHRKDIEIKMPSGI
jgi:hypothetical protein